MSFKACLGPIEAGTGRSPAALKAMAATKDLADASGSAPRVRDGQVSDWPRADSNFGHGHAMTIAAML